MGRYTPEATIEIPFDGETATVRIDRITFADATVFVSNKDSQNADLVRRYVKEFSGLTDADGKPITLEMALDKFYFASLVSEIIKAILATGEVPQEHANPSGKN